MLIIELGRRINSFSQFGGVRSSQFRMCDSITSLAESGILLSLVHASA